MFARDFCRLVAGATSIRRLVVRAFSSRFRELTTDLSLVRGAPADDGLPVGFSWRPNTARDKMV